jgi:hypothetical protein
LSACGGGSTLAAPGTASQSLPVVTVPTIAAATIAVANPASGMPLVVNIPMSSGSATLTFPVGTTVSPGTSIVVKTIDLASSSTTQAATRRSSAAISPTPPSSLAPGLYVQVIDGLINVSNPGGTQSFAAGQFGFVPSPNAPPIIVPANPGLQFVPPPSFVGTFDPSSPTQPPAGYKAVTSPSGAISFPLVLNQNDPTTLAIGPASEFSSTTSFLASSSVRVITGTAATPLQLPNAIDGGFTASMTFLTGTPKVALDMSFSLTEPSGVAAVSSLRRARSSIGANVNFSTALFVTLTAEQAYSSSATPSFAFAYPAGMSFNAGESLYVAVLDPTQPANGWTVLSGPGTVSGQTVTFTSTNIPTSLAPNVAYTYALISTAQTLTAPTPAPSSTPTQAPTPTPLPTPLVASTATAAMSGNFDELAVPAILPGLTANSNIVYSQTVTSATQNVTVSASAGNFASLTVPPGKTAVLFMTVSLASGTGLTFDNSTGLSLNLTGTLFAIGSSYTMTPTYQGATLTTDTEVAAPDDHPGDAGGGLLEFTSPLQGYTLSANQQVGIVISH